MNSFNKIQWILKNCLKDLSCTLLLIIIFTIKLTRICSIMDFVTSTHHEVKALYIQELFGFLLPQDHLHPGFMIFPCCYCFLYCFLLSLFFFPYILCFLFLMFPSFHVFNIFLISVYGFLFKFFINFYFSQILLY